MTPKHKLLLSKVLEIISNSIHFSKSEFDLYLSRAFIKMDDKTYTLVERRVDDNEVIYFVKNDQGKIILNVYWNIQE
jgi:hypothetical protein